MILLKAIKICNIYVKIFSGCKWDMFDRWNIPCWWWCWQCTVWWKYSKYARVRPMATPTLITRLIPAWRTWFCCRSIPGSFNTYFVETHAEQNYIILYLQHHTMSHQNLMNYLINFFRKKIIMIMQYI